MEMPKRKSIRLKDYDYSQNGAYFVTICTHNRECLFGDIVGADSISARTCDSISARMIDEIFVKTINEHKHVFCTKYVIMPNHFHAIIVIERADIESAPTLPQIVQSFKRYSTIEYIKMVKRGALPPFDKHIWQRGYYEHIIRNEKCYNDIWNYIDNNPLLWKQDCSHIK